MSSIDFTSYLKLMSHKKASDRQYVNGTKHAA